MYTVTLVLPSTKEGKEEVQKKYARLLAEITCEKLTFEQREMLISMLEKDVQN